MMYDDLINAMRKCATDAFACRTCTLDSNPSCTDILMKQAADAIEDLIVALTASNEVIAKSKQQWIPVTERFPEDRGDYLVYSVGGNFGQLSAIEMAFWDDKYFYVQSFFDVTHWMPLPEPPKDGEE